MSRPSALSTAPPPAKTSAPLDEPWRLADAEVVALSQARKAYGSPISLGFSVTGVHAAVNSITGEIRLLNTPTTWTRSLLASAFSWWS